jgi:hypothetical protein
VAEIDIRRILKELKTQRRQIDSAIAALESMVKGTSKETRKVTQIERSVRVLRDEMENGTTGRVVPFARGLELSG